MSTKHPAEDERGRFEELAERASNFTSSPAFFGGCAVLIALWGASFAAALLEQRRGNETAAQDDLAEAIGVHDEV